jgi:hypothetical protein
MNKITSVRKVSAGHYKVSILCEGLVVYTAIVTDMQLIDNYADDLKGSAEELYNHVLNKVK